MRFFVIFYWREGNREIVKFACKHPMGLFAVYPLREHASMPPPHRKLLCNGLSSPTAHRMRTAQTTLIMGLFTLRCARSYLWAKITRLALYPVMVIFVIRLLSP